MNKTAEKHEEEGEVVKTVGRVQHLMEFCSLRQQKIGRTRGFTGSALHQRGPYGEASKLKPFKDLCSFPQAMTAQSNQVEEFYKNMFTFLVDNL